MYFDYIGVYTPETATMLFIDIVTDFFFILCAHMVHKQKDESAKCPCIIILGLFVVFNVIVRYYFFGEKLF